MKYITTLILMFFITGCASYMTYEEMEDAYEIAETKEEKDALMKKILTFEDDWEKAIIYFEEKRICSQADKVTWYCHNVHTTERRRIKGPDATVRVYKRERLSCGCVDTRSIKDAFERGY